MLLSKQTCAYGQSYVARATQHVPPVTGHGRSRSAVMPVLAPSSTTRSQRDLKVRYSCLHGPCGHSVLAGVADHDLHPSLLPGLSSSCSARGKKGESHCNDSCDTAQLNALMTCVQCGIVQCICMCVCMATAVFSSVAYWKVAQQGLQIIVALSNPSTTYTTA